MQNFGRCRTVSIPWWTLRDDGHKSRMPRNCTLDYKVERISKFVRWEVLGYKKGQRLRDEDKKAHVGTLSSHMSYENSMRLYLFENTVGFVILALLIVTEVLPWMCALAFITLYDLYILYANSRLAPSDPGNSRLLVPMAFRLNWHFGVLLVIGYLIAYYIF